MQNIREQQHFVSSLQYWLWRKFGVRRRWHNPATQQPRMFRLPRRAGCCYLQRLPCPRDPSEQRQERH